jgi:GNAT superfamily N-acetyltransferase
MSDRQFVPAPELAELAFFVGAWDAEGIFHATPFSAEKAKEVGDAIAAGTTPPATFVGGVLATAPDGSVVHLRPLRRGERSWPPASFFAGLSAESGRRRFLQPMPRLPEATLGRLAEVDGRRHVAMVASLADEPGAAEVAVFVTDRYQGRGIGRLLVDALRLLRSLDADLSYRHGLVEGRQPLCAGRAVRG